MNNVSKNFLLPLSGKIEKIASFCMGAIREKEREFPNKIVNFVFDKQDCNEVKFIQFILVSGRFSQPTSLSPLDIYEDKSLLIGFSPVEASCITELAIKKQVELNEGDKCGVSIDIAEESCVIYDMASGVNYKHHICDLPEKEMLLRKISPQQLISIGIEIGKVQMRRVTKLKESILEKAKKNKKNN